MLFGESFLHKIKIQGTLDPSNDKTTASFPELVREKLFLNPKCLPFDFVGGSVWEKAFELTDRPLGNRQDRLFLMGLQ